MSFDTHGFMYYALTNWLLNTLEDCKMRYQSSGFAADYIHLTFRVADVMNCKIDNLKKFSKVIFPIAVTLFIQCVLQLLMSFIPQKGIHLWNIQ